VTGHAPRNKLPSDEQIDELIDALIDRVSKDFDMSPANQTEQRRDLRAMVRDWHMYN
jgi:hypothetical protein